MKTLPQFCAKQLDKPKVFCDLPPNHKPPCSFHLHGERANEAVHWLLEELRLKDEFLDQVQIERGEEIKRATDQIDELELKITGLREHAEGCNYLNRGDAYPCSCVKAERPVEGLSPGPGYMLSDVDKIEAARGKPYVKLRETVTDRDALSAKISLCLMAIDAGVDDATTLAIIRKTLGK